MSDVYHLIREHKASGTYLLCRDRWLHFESCESHSLFCITHSIYMKANTGDGQYIHEPA